MLLIDEYSMISSKLESIDDALVKTTRATIMGGIKTFFYDVAQLLPIQKKKARFKSLKYSMLFLVIVSTTQSVSKMTASLIFSIRCISMSLMNLWSHL